LTNNSIKELLTQVELKDL